MKDNINLHDIRIRINTLSSEISRTKMIMRVIKKKLSPRAYIVQRQNIKNKNKNFDHENQRI